MKYKLTTNDILRQGGIKKLERDGFKKEVIMKEMYRVTEGMSQQQRTEVVNKLFDRRNES